MSPTTIRRSTSSDHLEQRRPTSNLDGALATSSGGTRIMNRPNSIDGFDRNRVIGPKSGAKFLASGKGQRAKEHAENLGSDFTINTAALGSGDSSSSSGGESPTPLRRVPVPLAPASKPASRGGAPGGESRPVAAATSSGTDSATAKMATAPEGSLKELTRRASVEDEMIKANGDGRAARARKDSLSQAGAAGLRSPFGITPVKKDAEVSRHPPLSGGGYRSRTRSDASTTSTGSMNKDLLLSQLADALKKERRRCDMYQSEILSAERELDDVERGMKSAKEKYEGIIKTQTETIANLQMNLEELKRELETADDLDAEDAAKYLSLLGHTPSDLSKSSSSPEASTGQFSELGLKRVVSKTKTARRLESQLDAHPDGPFPTNLFSRRPRKLSKTRREGGIVISRPITQSPDPTISAEPRPTRIPVPVGNFDGDLEKDDEKSHPPVSGIKRLDPATNGQPRPRKNSFRLGLSGTLRNLFPAYNSVTSPSPTSAPGDPVPAEDAIQAWLKSSERSMVITDVGAGYGNPFLKNTVK